MTRCDRLALVVCLGVLLASYFISAVIFESIPHIEDEMAFTWQAKVIRKGMLSIPSPQPNPESFPVPFVVDYQGNRFSKYPIGWAVMLAFGEWLRIRAMINPIISGVSFWFIYRLIKKVLDERTALLAIMLGSISPFILINSGSLLSHPWSLLLTTFFIISWLDAFTIPNPVLPEKYSRWLPAVTGGFALGLLSLTRPWTAVGISLPFVFHAVIKLMRKPNRTFILRMATFCALAGSISILHFAWQYAVTGDYFTNPYTLVWPYDKVGFGTGIGLQAGGFQIIDAKANTLASLYNGNSDLFGWPTLSYLFLPMGVIAILRNSRAWLVCLVPVSLIFAYSFYWTHPQVVGPRYYFEAIPAVLMINAAGVRWMAGTTGGEEKGIRWHYKGRFRLILSSLVLGILIAGNLLFYLPARVKGMVGLYGITSHCLSPVTQFAEQTSSPVLVFVHVQKNFHEYTCTVDINDPFGGSNILTAVSRGISTDRSTAQNLAPRRVFHYYPDTGEFTQFQRDTPDPELVIP